MITFRIDSRTIKRGETRIEMRLSKCPRCSNSLHMHLGSSGVLTPLKNVYENMLTHVHKMIHLVVGIFEQGLETSLAECLPVECGQSDGATSALNSGEHGHCK